MTLSLTDGIAAATLSGAFVQEYSIDASQEVDETLAMVSGAAEVKHIYPYKIVNKHTVKGRGALSLSLGLAQTHGISGITGGVTHVHNIKYNEKVSGTAEWEFNLNHYPSAA